jgi:hypothetical protein
MLEAMQSKQRNKDYIDSLNHLIAEQKKRMEEFSTTRERRRLLKDIGKLIEAKEMILDYRRKEERLRELERMLEREGLKLAERTRIEAERVALKATMSNIKYWKHDEPMEKITRKIKKAKDRLYGIDKPLRDMEEVLCMFNKELKVKKEEKGKSKATILETQKLIDHIAGRMQDKSSGFSKVFGTQEQLEHGKLDETKKIEEKKAEMALLEQTEERKKETTPPKIDWTNDEEDVPLPEVSKPENFEEESPEEPIKPDAREQFMALRQTGDSAEDVLNHQSPRLDSLS